MFREMKLDPSGQTDTACSTCLISLMRPEYRNSYNSEKYDLIAICPFICDLRFVGKKIVI